MQSSVNFVVEQWYEPESSILIRVAPLHLSPFKSMGLGGYGSLEMHCKDSPDQTRHFIWSAF